MMRPFSSKPVAGSAGEARGGAVPARFFRGQTRWEVVNNRQVRAAFHKFRTEPGRREHCAGVVAIIRVLEQDGADVSDAHAHRASLAAGDSIAAQAKGYTISHIRRVFNIDDGLAVHTGSDVADAVIGHGETNIYEIKGRGERAVGENEFVIQAQRAIRLPIHIHYFCSSRLNR